MIIPFAPPTFARDTLRTFRDIRAPRDADIFSPGLALGARVT